MIREHVSFPGSQGVTLAGRLESPEGEIAAYALFAHCFSCSKDLKGEGLICRELVARGIAVLRFDFTGLGESAGDFADTNFSSNVLDLVAAADFLRHRGRGPALLVGHSLGGTAILAAAARIPDAVAVATIGAPAETAHLRRKLADRIPADPDTAVEIDLGGLHPVRIRRQLFDDLAADHLHGVLADLGKPLAIFHSPVDAVVGIEHAERLFLAARHPKSFISLGTADHLLSDPRDATHVGAVLAAWAQRYLPPHPAAHPAPPDELQPGEVEVRGGAQSLRQEIRAGNHHFVADEPVAQGGADAGPNPYDLLLAALGACTSMTLRLYANRKQLPLEATRVRLRHSHVHATDCEHCDQAAARIQRIERHLELTGPLTDQQRDRLLEIADRCPVHRTLQSKLEIVTRLA